MAESTIFPHAINLGATFDTLHTYHTGWVTALEMADVGHHVETLHPRWTSA